MVKLFEPLVDVLITHPYEGWEEGEGGKIDLALKNFVDYAKQVGKLILPTETYWDSLDDAKRARCIKEKRGCLF